MAVHNGYHISEDANVLKFTTRTNVYNYIFSEDSNVLWF